MRSSKRSRPTEHAYNPLRLIDLAYLVVLPPVVLILKLPMLLFLAIAIALIVRGKRLSGWQTFAIFLAGIVAVFLSFYGSLNYVGLSRLKLFVELLIYLLTLVVSLQRLSGKINLYLVVSPLLFMALSLFFFDDIAMLAYLVFEIFALLWLLLTWRMRTTPAKSVKMAAWLFVVATPIVTLLFIFFPRISFGHASYGFRGESIQRLGHDGTMRLDAGALKVLSGRIVMEVGFDSGHIPPDSRLYFRGSVLYFDKTDHWEPLPPAIKVRMRRQKYATAPMLEKADEITIYRVSLYPTRKRWLYMLDLPIEAPEGALINSDFEVTLKKPIDEPQIYAASSALHYRYGANTPKEILAITSHTDPARNPKTAEAARKIAETFPDERQRLDGLIAFFKKARLTYTLQPAALDLNRSTDSFLFDKKEGYCVHFASAFVTMARLAGLPARIVTGYKADRRNGVKNYLAVEERDAHAWAEVYINSHWERVETTATAAFATAATPAAGGGETKSETKGTAEERVSKLNLYLLYAKYSVETWILQYSRFRQMQLLQKARENPIFLLKFFVSIVAMVLIAFLVGRWLRKEPCQDAALCLLRPLLKRLKKRGCVRRQGETMHAFFRRCSDSLGTDALREIDTLYHRLRYAGDQKAVMELKRAVKRFLKHS